MDGMAGREKSLVACARIVSVEEVVKMQTLVLGSRLEGAHSSSCVTYRYIVQNLCDDSVVAKYNALKRLSHEVQPDDGIAGLTVEARLDIIKSIADERNLELY